MRSSVLPLALTCLFVLATGSTAQAESIFFFEFDNSPDGMITPPIVGTGTFDFAIDPGNGTHPLTSLGAFSMSFTFGATTFTPAHIVTPLSEILVILSPLGADRRVQFSNVLPFGSGPFGGAIDFINGVSFLSFEPPGFGGSLDLYFQGDGAVFFGNYLGVQPIPEPSSLALLGMGGAGLVVLARKRRSRLA
jgi:PEP-CTERM motif